MSIEKKNARAAKKAAREARQGKRVVTYVIGALIILFVLIFVGAMLFSF